MKVLGWLLMLSFAVMSVSVRAAPPDSTKYAQDPWKALTDACANPDNLPSLPGYSPKRGPLSATLRCVACKNLPGNHFHQCNPGSLDCAASGFFVPNDYSSCAFGPGACDCPPPD